MIIRIIYDRVRNRKNYFEIPTFLLIEGGISRVEEFAATEMFLFLFVFLFLFSFEFPALEVPVSYTHLTLPTILLV